MNKYFFALITPFILYACSSNPEEELAEASAQINVQCETFVYSMVDMDDAVSGTGKSRGVTLTEGNITRLNFTIFDDKGAVVFSDYQTSSMEDFGKISHKLKFGNYTLVAVARGGFADGQFNINSPTSATSTISRIFDTFSATQDIVIKSDSVQNITMNLDRAITLFTLRQNDSIPGNVKTIRFSFNTQQEAKELSEFNPTTKLSVGNYQTSREATLVTRDSQDLNFYAFLPATSSSVDIKVEALNDSGKVVVNHVFNGVPMKVSQRTIATGNLFKNTFSSGFTVNTDWLPDVIVPF